MTNFNLGKDIAKKLDWDSYDICDTFLSALTEANAHDLKVELGAVINKHFETPEGENILE